MCEIDRQKWGALFLVMAILLFFSSFILASLDCSHTKQICLLIALLPLLIGAILFVIGVKCILVGKKSGKEAEYIRIN